MPNLYDGLDQLAAETGFAGVVRIDVGGELAFARAYGLAHRGYGIENTLDTRFGIASGLKGMTAATVVSLIAEGRLAMTTTARAVLGSDLPLIADDVTVEHLLAHRSGIGDYLDEETLDDITQYVLSVPVHELATTEDFLRVLDGYPTKFPAGERFAYCNGGYVVLALIAERVAGVPFADLVVDRVCAPAGMTASAFLRSDELPGATAVGYLAQSGLRSNVFHLPVRGSGDGGIYATVGDIHRFWKALLAGKILPAKWVELMVHPRSDTGEGDLRYGLGFWLAAGGDGVSLVGGDAGVSFRSVCDRSSGVTFTVISNTTDGAWPIARHVAAAVTS